MAPRKKPTAAKRPVTKPARTSARTKVTSGQTTGSAQLAPKAHKPARAAKASQPAPAVPPRRGVIGPLSAQPTRDVQLSAPVFAEPKPSANPTSYTVPHGSDNAAYAEMDQLIKESKFLPIAFPILSAEAEPILTLAAALGPAGAAAEAGIQQAGQIVFQAAGDTGAVKGPSTENQVVDKLISDFTGEDANLTPKFFYNLGDVIYNFGEHEYYYDQFYDAYRDYPAPIFAIPGNHDGVVLPPPKGSGNADDSLAAFITNFCSPDFIHSPDAGGLSRTAMIQPSAYFTLEAPFVRILGLYSNQLENPGVISSTVDPTTGKAKFPNLSDVQLQYLTTALTRIKADNFEGAVLIAVHHPPYAIGKHSASLVMLKEIDTICEQVGVWPHAVLSGHAHNFQRYTRTIHGRHIPFFVIGNGGHGLGRISKTAVMRTPQNMPLFAQPERGDTVVLENYDDMHYGYLRVLVNAQQLRIEYHPTADGTTMKTPDDAVTVDLKTGTVTVYVPPA